MATGVASWSKTAASNATADSNVNWAEGQAPSSVNNSSRAEMASVAMWRDDISGTLVTGGTSTAFTLTTNQGFASLAAMDGAMLTFRMSVTNGFSPTLAVDGLTAKQIVSAIGTIVPTGALLEGSIYTVVYVNSATEFRLLNNFAVLSNTSFSLVKTGDGTKTAPGYSFTDDTDTGFYRIGANNIGISCGDTKILDVDTSGLDVVGAITASTTIVATSTVTGSGFIVGANPTATPGKVPTYQTFTSGSGTYTTASGATWIRVRVVGGGGGGGGTAGSPGTGGTSTFNSVNAIGGSAGANAAGTALGGAGGTGGTGTATLRLAGAAGGKGTQVGGSDESGGTGGNGGGTFMGAGGGVNAGAAAVNSGGGGGGVTGPSAANNGAGGGGGGEYFELIIGSPAASYAYAVGAAGTAGTNAGAAAAGLIVVEEYYN